VVAVVSLLVALVLGGTVLTSGVFGVRFATSSEVSQASRAALAANSDGRAAAPSTAPSTAPSSAPTMAPTVVPSPLPTAGPNVVASGYDHVVIIVMENHSLDSVLGAPDAPYLSSLAAGNSLATGYSGVSHPSLPNYLGLVGGSTFGITSDCTDCFLSAPSIADRIEASGRTWKAYEEGMPGTCFVGSSGRYAQKHDPFIYFNSIRNSPTRCGNIVPFAQMAADFAGSAAPNLAFVTPDLCNDTHDCPLATGDAWLSQQVPAIMSAPAFAQSRSLLVVTFDEGEGGSDKVLTVLAGTGVRTGYRSAAPYDHYSLLRTIEDGWSLTPMAAGDAGATPMREFFTP
jgi:phosphatidylinositol-3-phosphatase